MSRLHQQYISQVDTRAGVIVNRDAAQRFRDEKDSLFPIIACIKLILALDSTNLKILFINIFSCDTRRRILEDFIEYSKLTFLSLLYFNDSQWPRYNRYPTVIRLAILLRLSLRAIERMRSSHRRSIVRMYCITSVIDLSGVRVERQGLC